MNRKGQALVEFILILPIFLLLLLTIVDFGTLLNEKTKLENSSTDIVRLIRNGENIEKINKQYPNTKIDITEKDETKVIKVQKEIKIITPFLDKVLGNPCKIKSERIIPKEKSDNQDDIE